MAAEPPTSGEITILAAEVDALVVQCRAAWRAMGEDLRAIDGARPEPDRVPPGSKDPERRRAADRARKRYQKDMRIWLLKKRAKYHAILRASLAPVPAPPPEPLPVDFDWDGIV